MRRVAAAAAAAAAAAVRMVEAEMRRVERGGEGAMEPGAAQEENPLPGSFENNWSCHLMEHLLVHKNFLLLLLLLLPHCMGSLLHSFTPLLTPPYLKGTCRHR